MSDANVLSSPFGNLQLQRLPPDPSQTLRAWDAADEYLLQHLHEHHSNCQQPLIFNDSFGALSLSLHQQRPVSINDSFVSQQALQNNQQANPGLGKPSLFDSIAPLPEAPLAILKLPKNSRYFDYRHWSQTGLPAQRWAG